MLRMRDLNLAVAAQHRRDLAGNHVANSGAGRCKILARIEVGGIFGEVLADRGGHGQAQIRVDIDLADGHFNGLTQHLDLSVLAKNEPISAEYA